MKPLFQINLSLNEKDSTYWARVFSVEEDKVKIINGGNLKFVMSEVGKAIRKRQALKARFPLPEPSRIINPNGNGAPKLIVLARE